jgi:hypothetical protein
MKVTSEFLKEKNACVEGLRWVTKNNLIGLEDIDFVKKLIENDQLNWANWLIVRVMNYNQYVSYAIFAAEQVISIYEKKYPNDNRPYKAIEAARKCIENPTDKNKNAAAAAAADAAYAAADADAAAAAAYAAAAAAAYAAYAAAAAAAYAAYAAAADAYAAAAAYAAYAAAADAYAAAADAYAAARKDMRIKILEYGLSLLEKK